MRLTGPVQPSSLVLDALACFGKLADIPETLVVAVSGGSDSMALLRLAHYHCGQAGKTIIALTVDHGLREASASEAEQVAAWCADLGVEHHTLRWHHDGKGNLSAAAREGRYLLMAEFCKSRSIAHLYTGHTADDQAETVLMRLARGSGVDGLAGMAHETTLWGVTVVRPFILDQSREDLRRILGDFEQEWIDDPTNADPGYDRVKARDLLSTLEPLGLGRGALSGLAHRMELAKRVLEREADRLEEGGLSASRFGYLTLDAKALAAAEVETACRVIGRAMKRLSGSVYRAHLSFEEQLLKMALKGEKGDGMTHGTCLMRPDGDNFHILREPARCAPRTQEGQKNGLWDRRFRFDIQTPSDFSDATVGALGEAGLAQVPKDHPELSEAWQAIPREVRLTTPGLWRGEILLSAPLAPWSAGPDGPDLRVETVWPASC